MFFRDPLMSPLQIGLSSYHRQFWNDLGRRYNYLLNYPWSVSARTKHREILWRSGLTFFRASLECLIGQLRSDSDIPSVPCQFFALLTALINCTWVYCFIWSAGFVTGLKHGPSCISVLGASLWTKRRSCWN